MGIDLIINEKCFLLARFTILDSIVIEKPVTYLAAHTDSTCCRHT